MLKPTDVQGKKLEKKCTSHIIKENNLAQKIITSIDSVVKGQIKVNDISSERVRELESELKTVNKLLDKQKTMFKKDIIDIDELIIETEKLRQQEKQITKELNSYNKAKNIAKDELDYIVDNMESIWQAADEFERKEIMTRLFQQIVVDTKDEYKRGTGKAREIIIVSVK